MSSKFKYKSLKEKLEKNNTKKRDHLSLNISIESGMDIMRTNSANRKISAKLKSEVGLSKQTFEDIAILEKIICMEQDELF